MMHEFEWNQIAEEVSFNLEIDLDYFSSEVPIKHRVLDFGCGYGRISKQLWDFGYSNIVGIDSSQKMIERGNREYPELQLDVVSGGAISLPDDSFDAIVACAVFTCITTEEARRLQSKELVRILKPDGILHLVEFCSDPSKGFTSSIGVPMLHSSPRELRDLVSSLQIIKDETCCSNTISDRRADCLSLFARKNHFHDESAH